MNIIKHNIDKQLSGLVLQYADIGKANSLEEYYPPQERAKIRTRIKLSKSRIICVNKLSNG